MLSDTLLFYFQLKLTESCGFYGALGQRTPKITALVFDITYAREQLTG
nr:MAG TPA: hypothetical protein [Caudoviricetes sp.]